MFDPHSRPVCTADSAQRRHCPLIHPHGTQSSALAFRVLSSHFAQQRFSRRARRLSARYITCLNTPICSFFTSPLCLTLVDPFSELVLPPVLSLVLSLSASHVSSLSLARIRNCIIRPSLSLSFWPRTACARPNEGALVNGRNIWPGAREHAIAVGPGRMRDEIGA